MIQGEIHTLPLTDLIQWLALKRRTGKLAVQHANQSVEFYFINGEIAAASTIDLDVLDRTEQVCTMLGMVLGWSSGSFAFNNSALPLWVASANLRLSVETLLLDVASLFNRGQKSEAAPSSNESNEAHQYSETFTLADALRLEVVDRLLSEKFTVPAKPQLAARVLDLARNEDFSLRDLGNLILTDQAVAAAILRYANAAAHGSERQVDSLAVAVQRLGAEEVINIVLAASIWARPRQRDLFAAERRSLSTQAAVAAFIARALAARAGLNHHLGFLCGLLMDFGMTVLYSLIQEALNQQTASKQVPAEIIKEIVRDYHPRVGRVVGEQWRLPSAVVEAMAYHHCVEESGSENPYIAVAALTDFLTNFVLSTPREKLDEDIAGFAPEWLASNLNARLLNLDTEGAAAILEDLPQNLDQALKFVVD